MGLKKTAAANASEIRQILGSVDDDLIMQIIKSGASASDVMQAAHWLETGGHNLNGIRKFSNEVVCRVYDILMADRNRFLSDD